MRTLPHPRAIIALALLLLAAIGAAAAQRTITLPELLNHHWTRELVTYPFHAEKGACVKGSVRLSGPRGPLPVQLTDVKTWPGTETIRSATLAFVVEDLLPLATNIYAVSYGATPAPGAAPATDLAIQVSTDSVEAISSHFGVRLLVGERTYAPPAPAADVPGPVQAMRLADGTWFGGSRLVGDTPVAGYTARLTEAGPVLIRVECQYRYADGNTNTIAIQLNARGDRITFATQVTRERLSDGWDLRLDGLPPLAFQFMPEHDGKQPGTHAIKGWRERLIADYPAGQVSNLVPWGDWFNEFTQPTLHLAFLDTRAPAAKPVPGDPDPPAPPDPSTAQDARELVVHRLDAGAWITPPSSGGERAKARVPLIKARDGTLFLRVSHKAGARRWTVGEAPSYRAKLAKVLRPSNVMQDGLDDLDLVKDMVLNWPEGEVQHPRLFLDPEDMQAAVKRHPEGMKTLRNVDRLRAMLGSYVFFDTMRQAAGVICLYDAIIDSDLISPRDRRLFRAQMAYLVYRLASPANWSYERSYKTGNPNMTVAHTVNQGLAACVLSDHPMAEAWSRQPNAFMDRWLDRLDAAGHWPESSGYARVSESKVVFYAIAAQRAGLHDFLSDERFRRMAMYYERTLTPPDPQRKMKDGSGNPRVSPPYGRGGNGNSVGIGGLIAKAVADLDPAFSRVLQWSFAGTRFSTSVGERMEGYERLLLDRTLPTERPDWRSELLPSVGALFRGGVGTPEENYLLLLTKYATNPDGEIWPSEVGALTLWFEHGRPLTRVFPAGSAYDYLHGLTLNRVMLASSYEPGQSTPAGYLGSEAMTGFATLPRLDYIGERYRWRQTWSWAFQAPHPTVPAFPRVKRRGALPGTGVTWHRQALYVRDADAGGKNYLVLRDTVAGDQPTQWQFWTLSDGITSLDGGPFKPKARTVDDSLEALFAKDADESLPVASGLIEPVLVKPTQLTGRHFLAKGQFGLDLDTFVASPADTPRHTLRHSYNAPSSGVVGGFRCTQDLLHLQLSGDGAYFVALVPREPGEAAPTFALLGDGTVIKVAGAFGTDYVFLADTAQQATADAATFFGTVACVQDRTNGLVLALGAEGSVTCGALGLAAAIPAELRATADALTVSVLEKHAGGQVTVTAPPGWKLAPSSNGTTLTRPHDNTYTLALPAGVTKGQLDRR